jgi:hypothetical protein
MFKITPAVADELTIDVYKSLSCSCCEKWVSHMEDNGFNVISHNMDDMSAVKTRFNISRELQSCHTGVIGGYFIEGHVPASDVKKLLADKPAIKGLTAPGMPAGSNVPGMEVRPGKANFDVLEVGSDGGTEVYSHYE